MRRRWSASSSVLRVTFSVASTVRSATSRRIWSRARRVSCSMSRRVCCMSSSRDCFASVTASSWTFSAERRARTTMSSACSRASRSRSRYSRSSESASWRVRSAWSIDCSIAIRRLSSASWIGGDADLRSSMIVMPNAISVQIITPTPGWTRKLPLPAAVTCRALIALTEEERDQAEDERVEHDRLGEGEAQPLDRGDLVAHLGLARDRLDHLAEDVADADARADRAEAGTDAEGDRLAAGAAALGDDVECCSREAHGSSLVSALGDRAAEVDGSESGEDECLEAGDQHDLEDEEDDGDRKRDDAQRRNAQEHDHAAAHEEDEQVPGEQVREKPDRQRDDPDEVRDHLDHEEERLQRARRALGDERGEVSTHAVGPDALDLVAEPHDKREHERHRDVRRGCIEGERRDLEAEDVGRLLGVGRQGDVADQVREEDEEEQGADEREPLLRVFLGHVPAHDVVVRDVIDGLHSGLHVIRPLLHLPADPDHGR